MSHNRLKLYELKLLPNRSEFTPISWPWYCALPLAMYKILHKALATVEACQQKTLTGTLPDIWFRPFLGLSYTLIVESRFYKPAVILSTFHIELFAVISRFYVLNWGMYQYLRLCIDLKWLHNLIRFCLCMILSQKLYWTNLNRENGRDLSPMTKAPTPTEKFKKQSDNTKTPPKASITQRLRTEFRRSVVVTTATQLVWLNRFTGSQTFPPRKPCNQNDTHLKICK